MTSSHNSSDPFLQVQSDVLALLNTTRPLFSSYLRIRASATTASSPELADARAELEANLTDLSTDLADLIDSVKAIEQDPYRYGIELAELERRRRLVGDVGREIGDMQAELKSAISKGASQAQSNYLPDPEEFEGEDGYAAFEEERQMEMMHEQDEALDEVFHTVGNLRAQADTMGRELEEQHGMLEDVEVVADRVGGKLQTGLKRVGRMIEQNEDRWSSCCIGVLIFVLILLLVLLLVL